MYKNPLKIMDPENNGFGDPFVMRWNGTYYLYPSTHGSKSKIFCYTSKDMINFRFEGAVAEDAVLKNAYAPEVIYYEGYFYLVTSPSGKGHYLFKSDSPLGPFKRISENINNMIDGSFFINSENKLFLLRANHQNISMLSLDVDTCITSNRVDLNAPLNAWTEGPGLFYFNNYYFLIYTGNDVCSTGYRVNYSTSNEFDSDFTPGCNNPILISTEGPYKRFGHSSNVLGLNLDSYYTYFHELVISKKGKHSLRRVMLERLDFNGRMMSANYSLNSQSKPQKILESSNSVNSLEKINQNVYLFKNKNFKNQYTLESVIKNDTKILISYKNEEECVYVSFNHFNLKVTKLSLGKEEIKIEKEIRFDFNNYHTVRVIYQKGSFEILIDNAPVITFNESASVDRVGFIVSSEQNIMFNGINKSAYNSSIKSSVYTIPGLLFPITENKVFYRKYGTFAGLLKKNDNINYRINGNDEYVLFVHAKLNDVVLKINEKEICLLKSNDEFEFNEYLLGKYSLKDELNIEVVSGEIEFDYIRVIKRQKHDLINQMHSRIDRDKYALSERDVLLRELSFSIRIKKKKLYQKAGCLIQAANYSENVNQARYPISGLLIGIENSLLTIDYLNYGCKRIYDVPVNLKEQNNIKVLLNNNEIKVYLNDEEKIKTNIPYLNRYGRIGIYVAKESALSISDFNYMEDEFL